jgi:transposase
MGELYTVVTNKEAKGKKGAIVAVVAGSRSATVIDHLQRISSYKRNQVIEITLDMTNSMKLIARKVFPKAKQVTDLFHVLKLALEAVQEIQITIKWEALDREIAAITQEKITKTKFIAEDFTNGDTPKPLLTRSRFLLHKSLNKWSGSQKERAVILFKECLKLKETYLISQQLRNIYNNNTDKAVAITN